MRYDCMQHHGEAHHEGHIHIAKMIGKAPRQCQS